VVCLKGGRTEGGARAARSHTGALASGARVLEAVMKQSGVTLVDTTEEMLDVANALARAPRAAGKRVRILTNAGGPGVLAADHVVRRGLELPPLSATAQQALRAFVPTQAATGNPVDLTAAGAAPMYAQASRLLLDDAETDALLAVLVTPPGVSADDVRAVLQSAAAQSAKPVVAAFVAQPELLRQEEAQRLATVAYPESAAAVLAALARPPRDEPSAAVVKAARLSSAPDLEESFRLLKKYGIPVVPYRFARKIPKRARFPLAMKLVSPEIIHKTEAGAVALNIRNMRELRAAWPKRKVRGVILQPMVSTRRELILGFRRDEAGTPMVLAGLGGVLAEALDAVSLRVLPVTGQDALEMLAEIPGNRALDAFRGWPPMNRRRIAEVILRLAQLGSDHAQIAEIDINPLVEPCHALDARILLR
jgi:acetyltransferase